MIVYCKSEAATPLYQACSSGKIDNVPVLLYNNTDPNVLNASGFTSLCVAAITGHVEIAELLIKAGAKVDLQKANIDWTRLLGGNFKVVELLLKYGASLKENKHGITPQVAPFLAGLSN